jgi:hypothetical protein
MNNTHPTTGVRYGVISDRSLDSDLSSELFYGSQATDLSYAAAYAEATVELGSAFDDAHEEATMAAAETGGMTEAETEAFVEQRLEAALGTSDREDYVEWQLECGMDGYQCDEPTIEGTYEGVQYRIDWLGGAPLIWVFEGPLGNARQLCSPCVPNAADLDSGFTLDSELESKPGSEEFEAGVSAADHDNLYPCYCVPRDWLRKETTT